MPFVVGQMSCQRVKRKTSDVFWKSRGDLWGGKAQRQQPRAEWKGLEFYRGSHLALLPALRSWIGVTLGKPVSFSYPQ